MERGISLASFGVLLIAALVGVPLSGSVLPTIVASHFNAAGAPNGFMPRGMYVLLMTALTVGLPPLIVASAAWRIQRHPSRLRLPNRDHWLAPERRAQSAAYLIVHTTRFASALILLMCWVHALVVRANLLHPPRLEIVPLLAGLVVFVLATLAWVWVLHARFARSH
jgi:hypothetical protein